MQGLKGKVPESWHCVDCGVNTAPGLRNRAQMESAFSVLSIARDEGVEQIIDHRSEVYTVKPAVWQAAGMEPMAGCLCIGCLEKRLGRILRPKDFNHHHPFHSFPGTRRLQARRKGLTEWVERQRDGSLKLCRVNGSTVEVTDLDDAAIR